MNNRKNLFELQIVLSVSLLLYFCSIQSVIAQQNVEVIENIDKDTTNIIKGIFDIPELEITPSPNSAQHFTFSNSEKIIDYDVSPAGMNVATLVVDKSGNNYIKFWQFGSREISDSLLLTKGLVAKAIVWHPNADALFVMGVKDAKNQIFSIRKSSKEWVCKSIYSTPNQLRRLIICPRPFITNSDDKTEKYYYTYRLFFGMDNGDKTYRIVSITENGKKFYQVIGPAKTFTKANNEGPETREMESESDTSSVMPELISRNQPSKMKSDWALPSAFHPGGHQLIWEDRNNNFYCANYDSRYWEKSKPMDIVINKHGTITPTPNGLGLIHWQNDKPGIGIYLLASKKEEIQLQNYRFIFTPSSTPDGKGIIGLTLSDNRYTLNYLPVEVPMADVINAWMYASSNNEIDLFQKNLGLFRPNQDDQLYKLYETENYYCGDYDRNTPTRPYLVTTDIFWELFGAAYQGIFIVKERDVAIPNFLKFIAAANNYTKQSIIKSVWTDVFSVLQKFISGDSQTPEVKRIQDERDCISGITNKEYAYSDLKPRGHYTSSPEMENYFKAFCYFTTICKSDQEAIKELNLLPKEVKVYAEKWIESYGGFISPSQSPLVWENMKVPIPKYCLYPQNDLTIFPLSWGFDNEVLYSTVYHEKVPTDFQIPGRMLPSGLDLATVLGNGFAEKLLESDYAKYPNLHKVIANLKKNYEENNKYSNKKDNLYSSWMDAIAVQWADTVKSINGLKDRNIWQTKRLQTGLATWATLRHATVLVNERTAAECGEGGFEEILMRAPRGYVEPDPYTFAAIAELFETAIQYVSKSIADKPDLNDIYESDRAAKISLYDGIIGRLKEVAKEARSFQSMAEKEKRGEVLSNEDNTEILFIARVAEHNFLVFNSLSNKDYALSNPDPIAKIADIAGGGDLHLPYLMAAVGNTMEWNHIVPFYGRHEIVKGSVYSYYEFESKQILNDKEWQKKVTNQKFLPWINPFITTQNSTGVAQTSY